MINLYYVRILKKKSEKEELHFEGILDEQFIFKILEKYAGNIGFNISIRPLDLVTEFEEDSEIFKENCDSCEFAGKCTLHEKGSECEEKIDPEDFLEDPEDWEDFE